MNELLFLVDETPEDGLAARALWKAIVSASDNVLSLQQQLHKEMHAE